MMILLLQDIKGLGKRMEMKNVSDGYARNFLIPCRLAVPADKKAQAKKDDFENKLQIDREKYYKFAGQLEKEKMGFAVKVGDQGEIYESVNKEKITKLLSDKGYSGFEVVLPRPLRQLGEHIVEIKFPQSIKIKTQVILKPIKEVNYAQHQH